MYEFISSSIIGITFVMAFIIPIIIFIVIVTFIVKTVKNSVIRAHNIQYFAESVIKDIPVSKYTDVSKSKLEEFNIDDIGSFKNSLYEIFEEFERAYNSLDYNSMKQISTSQLYENYYTGINLNIKDGKKKVFDEITRKKVVIFAIDSTAIKQVVQTLITISYYSYTIDKNGYIVSGSKNNKITESFEVTFKKEYSKESLQKCPNCGATVTGKRCEYCRSIIKDNEFKISAIKKVAN